MTSPIVTGERVFSKVQEGVEVTPGTPVATTAMLNMSGSSMPDLDRAEGAPQEDYGVISDRQSGRAYYGVTLMKFPMKGIVRFEDIMRYLEAALSGGIVPTTPDTGVYLWTYAGDDTADTVKARTLKMGDQINVYRAAYCLVEKIHIFYDALAAGQNAPWQLEVDYFGQDLPGGSSFDAVSAVSRAETPMGHKTRIYIGPTSTAFGSLSEITGSLVKLDLTIETGITQRKSGGTTDTYDTHGRLNRKITWTGTVFATAAGYSGYYSPFQSAVSSAVVEKRVRFQSTGSLIANTSYRQATIDQRAHVTAVKHGEHNGAAVYEVTGSNVDDATLASNIAIAVQNGVATL